MTTVTTLVFSAFAMLALSPTSTDMTPPKTQKTLIDYFRPSDPHKGVSAKVWGAATVGPRDPLNGLEDSTMTKWNYWDGQIIKGSDGRYHLYASRWDQGKGHNDWWESKAVQAVSDRPDGPYKDQGLCWPGDEGGKGHNVTALLLKDGQYAIVVSETRPGDVFTSKSPSGPWTRLGSIQVDANGFDPQDARMSNVSVMLRPDGDYEIVPRSGAVLLSKDGILGPYKIQGPSIYKGLAGLPQHDLEDPVIWHSGGLYHIVVNCWSERKAFHLTSLDGIGGWANRGLAYEPDADFIRTKDGVVNHWNKLERPGVFLVNGHVAYFTFAVIDVPKDDEKGNDGHGSKVIVVPFDGQAMDKDLGGRQPHQ